MSKRFTKILIFCVLAVAVIAIVVASAICMTNAVSCKITVDTSLITEAAGGNVNVKINGESKSALNVKKDSEVTLSFEAEGYDFIAWYDVAKKDVAANEAVSEEVVYKFKATDNMNFTAVFDAVLFDITYIVDTDMPEISQQTLTYGAALPTVENPIPVTDSENNIISYKYFRGWMDPADPSKLITEANFSSDRRGYELTALVSEISDYDFVINVKSGEFGQDGIVYFDSLTGVTTSTSTPAKRPFYVCNYIMIDEIGETQLAVSADVDEDYQAKLTTALAGLVDATSDEKEVEVSATAVWQFIFDSVTIAVEGDEGVEVVIEKEGIGNIETMNLLQLLDVEECEGIHITFNGTRKTFTNESYKTFTILNVLEAFAESGFGEATDLNFSVEIILA